MKILALDTSGAWLGVALRQGGETAFAIAENNGLTHSDNLLPLLDGALTAQGLTLAQVDLLAAVTGPGSFTGVRIGVETVRALARTLGKPCIGINALEALAAGAMPFDGIICPMQDARAGQVYAAAFQNGARVLPDAALALGGFIASLPEAAAYCFVGDGAERHRDALRDMLGTRAAFAPAARMHIDPAVVAQLAEQYAAKADSWQALLPYYLRAPQAERERLAREAKAHG
ncbi:MAG: tRNA (adenosine(37)-N6)-threonylcarbamoyltransferase complex dimerization subunit type 1 TsaB [Oscillospiraceae bacterium]|jgi:tRNA threonylcarbamoyladenosine biosynthesis protein TsaB|nr:tRNA (adenosine(37)-N6)-threonylcarbamoyltransferase complex dimerization subunit type 1 TsaB [Oscillospiraceae bacterium]